MNKYYELKRKRLYRRRTRKTFKMRAKRNREGSLKYFKELHIQELVFLREQGFCGRKKLHQPQVKIVLPKVFSLTQNPDKTLEVLRQIADIGYNNNVCDIYIDHTGCKELGIAASTIMDVILMSIEKYRKNKNIKCTIGGVIDNENIKVKAILAASGILKHLGFDEDKEWEEKVITLDLVTGSHSNSAQTATKIADYFNSCLGANNYEFTDKGYNLVGKLIGEVIDNCSMHAKIYCKQLKKDYLRWYALGHYHHYDEGYGECQLVLFNFGKTIYEGLKDSKDEYVPKILKRLTNAREIDIVDGKTTEEVLWTLYSLQEGISRLKDEDKTHGTGTITLLDTFNSISGINDDEENSDNTGKMSIISGKAYIKFDKKYMLSEDLYGIMKSEFKVIAFNDSNNLLKSPDYEYVRILKSSFPGTVISMQFPLDEKYISKLKND